jgi:NAD(P)-dependent dehydrogenase (short-subunit alcohol dehydrogenase family)
VATQGARVADFTGRTVVVTGSSSGIGRAAATTFAQRGARVVLVGRDADRLAAATSAVRDAGGGRAPVAYRADFEHFADIHGLVDHIIQRFERVDVLANNAGGLVRHRTVTADGFEATIQANHLAGFLLTNLLREQLRNGRVINTSSVTHALGSARPDRLDGNALGLWRAYATSKRANVLFAAEAARRWPDILSASYSPGIVKSRFGSMFALPQLMPLTFAARTPEQGADTLLWLAATPTARLVNGGYYVRRTLRHAKWHADDAALAAALWDASLRAVGLS